LSAVVAPDAAPHTPGEFRPYRRFVSWFILTFVSLGSAYLLVSVGVTIYRRQHAVPLGSPVGAVASEDEIKSCLEELTDVFRGLEKHLENFHNLIAHYDVDEAQRWAEDKTFWIGQWKAAGGRCHFQQPRAGKLAKEWEQLGEVYAALQHTEESYTKELIRFGQNQAPSLDHISQRLTQIGKRMSLSPETRDVQDSRDPNPAAAQNPQRQPPPPPPQDPPAPPAGPSKESTP
jgi:hypothetical protein